MPSSVRKGFRTKRGRPPAVLPQKDTGTPELAQKRAAGTTGEIMDNYLQKGDISPAQHRTALHLRWLYTLRHGRPTVQALTPEATGTHRVTEECEDWKAQREQEYREALQLLESLQVAQTTLNSCVFHLPLARAHMPALRLGLSNLARLWGYK